MFSLKGASFVENWVDGYAFTELIKKQEQISSAREEIERQRKLLGKKRPSVNTLKSKSPGNGAATAASSTCSSISTISIPNTSCSGSLLSNASANGDFLKPEIPKDMNWYNYFEQDEILKLRSAALKKEDADLQIELEKLERERNLHIRELKRIHNEDQSRFNNHQTLNDRYLLLTLLGKGNYHHIPKLISVCT